MTLLQKPLSGLFTTLENGTFIGFLNNCFFKKRLFAGTPFIVIFQKIDPVGKKQVTQKLFFDV